MTFLRNHARLAALVLGGLFIASCDSRLPTAPGGGSGGNPADQAGPRITFALSAGTNNTVDLGAPLTVTVTATDDYGVEKLNTTLNNGPTVVGADTSTLNPTQATTSRTITVPMSGRKDGDQIAIISTASDASLNFTTDTLVVTIADTVAPRMIMTSKAIANAPRGELKGGDSLDVQVTASDSSGMRWAGYRVYRLGGADSTTVVFGDSVAGAAGATSVSGAFGKRFDLKMNIGTYRVVGFAVDNSGRITNPGPTLNFTIRDGEAPTLNFIAPKTAATLNIGDSLLVRVDLHDNVGLKNVQFYAVSPRGDIALGSADTVIRYDAVTAPQGGALFRSGLTDTLDLKRWLPVHQPLDTIPGKLLVYGIVTDAAGNVTRDTVVIQMTKGPNVSLLAPIAGDSLTRGTKLRISVSAASGVGVTKLGFDVRSGTSGPAWPTPVVATYDTNYTTSVKTAGPYVVDIDIPPDAPSKGVLTIAPHATDINGQPGAPTPQDFFVRVGAAPPPLVRQSIATRVELEDTVTVYASGAALTQVGYVIRDVLTHSRVDSGAVAASSSSFGPKGIKFSLKTEWQGKRVSISAFARDSAGNVGWAVPTGVSTPITDTTKMARDTTLIVYGRTFSLPAGRAGVASDISVDSASGSVFISNTQYNRLERWTSAMQGFDPSGIAVGSQPWGMALQNDGDTLLVANSGGTNISKVCIDVAACGGVGEILSARLQTRSTYVFTITEARDAATGKIRLTLAGPFTYSDRPQYVQQSAGGRVFYSTRPTSSAPAGTIRWLDPKKKVPDPRQIWQYAAPSGDATTYAVFNSDSILIIAAPANTNKSDQLVIFDHVYGDTVGGSCNGVPNVLCNSADSVVTSAAAKVVAQGGDVEAVNNLDVASLNLTDTTFVAASGDRSWIGFGEGNTGGGTGRVMMVNDPAGSAPGYFSPGVTVRDILNNASESVFGLGIDLHGANVVVHGQESYFAALESPFHLRLQGTYDSFSSGAGVTFHPSADLRNGYFSSSASDSTRTAFVASSNGSIEVVDAKYFVTRGSLVIKNNLYGALRASLPFPTDNQGISPSDPNYIVLKLFGLTPKGLVVINLRASDIQPVP